MRFDAILACASAVGVLAACTVTDPVAFGARPRRAGTSSSAPGAGSSAPSPEDSHVGSGDDPTGAPPHPSPSQPNGSDAGAGGGGSTPASDAGTVDSAVLDSAPSDGFDVFQHRNLDAINTYRAGQGLTPLTLDTKMSAFASAGSQELSQDHAAHQHFVDASNNGTLFTDGGFSGGASETQGDPSGWPQMSQDPTLNENGQIDGILKAMMDEGPGGGHHDAIMDPDARRLGVGLVEVQGQLYLTNDFSQ